jgi:hypothetical protein
MHSEEKKIITIQTPPSKNVGYLMEVEAHVLHLEHDVAGQPGGAEPVGAQHNRAEQFIKPRRQTTQFSSQFSTITPKFRKGKLTRPRPWTGRAARGRKTPWLAGAVAAAAPRCAEL